MPKDSEDARDTRIEIEAARSRDLIITLAVDVKYVCKKLDEIDERLKTGDCTLNAHDKELAVLATQTTTLAALVAQKADVQKTDTLTELIGKHLENHWRFATLTISFTAVVVAAVTFVGHALGVI